jgi:hypothetical protein
MARRSLSTQGRILAAGVSVAVGGALVGIMASGDHTATATTSDPSVSTGSATSGTGGPDAGAAVPYGGGNVSGDQGTSNFPAQPQTRTGGS